MTAKATMPSQLAVAHNVSLFISEDAVIDVKRSRTSPHSSSRKYTSSVRRSNEDRHAVVEVHLVQPRLEIDQEVRKKAALASIGKFRFETIFVFSLLFAVEALLLGVTAMDYEDPGKFWITSSLSCPTRMAMMRHAIHDVECCCSVLDHGAIGDNITMNTIPIQKTIDTCHDRCRRAARRQHVENDTIDVKLEPEFKVLVYVPPGSFQTGSLLLKSNLQFHLASGASLYGSVHTYPIVPMLPNGYVTGKAAMWRALIAGYDLENVSVTGENDGAPSHASVIDGVGWKWWCWTRSFPQPQPFCQDLNPSNATLPKQMMRPKLIEFYNSTNIVLQQFTAQNAATWTIHPFACRNVTMANLTVLAPRAIGNTDGIDPDSCVDVMMDSCYIDVGDDAVSIKSTNVTPGVMWPTNNVYMTNSTILSRNWCIGSATFGGISNVVFEDSRIGSTEQVTSPWAIKFKSHRYFPGAMENITIRRIVIGKIGPTPWMYPEVPGYGFQIGLSYNSDANPSERSGSPLFRNVTFEDIVVTSAGVAGNFHGLPEDCLQGLTLRNVSVLGGKAQWNCDNVDLTSLRIENVFPPLSCNGGCNSTLQRKTFLGIDFKI
ncbi:endopolygalacturonase [Nitzschia inconspicua]|uniref:Endopolygalacturonase n=1 Tax=Nitzschia inconspicua TaxID=303405 RepID=A0A9K3L3K8_9STRA|nr:endopolygalacturonase [Nitzschia inconspicua]